MRVGTFSSEGSYILPPFHSSKTSAMPPQGILTLGGIRRLLSGSPVRQAFAQCWKWQGAKCGRYFSGTSASKILRQSSTLTVFQAGAKGVAATFAGAGRCVTGANNAILSMRVGLRMATIAAMLVPHE